MAVAGSAITTYRVSLRGIPRLQRLKALSGADLGRCPRLLHSAPLALRAKPVFLIPSLYLARLFEP